ncbi:MAG: ATP-binding protein, partial [Planctomycetota bacterium]
EARARAARAVESFPSQLARLTGREAEDLDRLQEFLGEAREKYVQSRQKRDAAKKRMADSRLPEQGVAAALISELRLKCQKLRQLADNIEAKESERSEAVVKATRARQAIGSASDEEKLGDWTSEMIDELAGFARRAERARAEKHAIDHQLHYLRSEPDDENAAAPELLSHAIRLLHRWLAYQQDQPNRFALKHVLFATAGITVICSIVMSTLVHGSWLALLLVAAGLAAWAVWPRRSRDRRAELESEFAGLGVDEPATWTEAEVQVAIRELQRKRAAAELDRVRDIRRGDLVSQSRKADARCQRLEEERAQWTRRLGLSIDDQNPDETWLFYLVQHGVDYQKAEADVAAVNEALRCTQQRHESMLGEVNDALRPYGYPPAKDAEQVSGFVEDLHQRAQSHENARQGILSNEEALQGIERDIQRWQGERAELFERAGLEVGEESTLRQWAGMHPEYRTAAENLRHAARDFEAAEAALGEHADLTTWSKAELLEAQRRSRDQADTLEQLDVEIGGIEREISNAKRASDLEEALARKAECEEALRRQRDADCDLVAGHLLADFLARRERDRERPAVFKQAQKLFVDITHGHFRLDIAESDPPAFRAFDTGQGRGLALDQLSSGTRLQLLLAVKLAFIERQEQGPKLPLILDETLANSDERRAGEIIDSAIEICREGRQVFYLTAQYDEVEKWKQVLARQQSFPSKFVNLAEVRELEEAEAVLPATAPAPSLPDPPSPDGVTWWEYGQCLRVPPYNPSAEPGHIHLWYLMDDLPALHRLLKQGITHWEQLTTLMEYGSVSWLASDSPLRRQAEARARLLESIARYWRIGRGRPVDRQVLMESEAVSDTFIDRVSNLAERAEGDAKELLAALDRGEVKGFRADKRNDLAEYLSERGYLDERETMSLEQIREHVQPLVFADLEQGLLDMQQFEQLFAAVLRQGE